MVFVLSFAFLQDRNLITLHHFENDLLQHSLLYFSSSFPHIPPSGTRNNRASFMSLYSDL